MNSRNFTEHSISAAEMHAVIARAHAIRAEVMLGMLSNVATAFKRLVGRLRPSGQHLPQAGSWTLRAGGA